MILKQRKLFGLALLAGASGLAGCTTTSPLHLIVDPSLATAEVYEVDGLTNYYWTKPVKFGPFHTEKTHTGGTTWEWTSSRFEGNWFSGREVEVGTQSNVYRFVFVGEKGDRWQVDCRANTPVEGWRTRHSEATAPTGNTRLGCVMRDPAGAVHSLELLGDGRDFHGEAEIGDGDIGIRALHDLPDRNGNPFTIPGALGYELRQGETVVASVDLLGKGRVYLARDLPAELRSPVALTATVLMFFHRD